MSRGKQGGGLETSDMNDGEILTKTAQTPCGKNGFQLSYKLPDGHELKSECVNAEHRSTALLQKWVDSVKEQAVLRVDQMREEQAALARQQAKEQQKLLVPGPSEKVLVPERTGDSSTPPATVIPAGPLSSGEPLQTGSSPFSPSATPSYASDPVAMARSELVRASLEVQELQPKLAAAQQRVAQWQAVLTALSAVELPKESAVIQTPSHLLERR